MYTLTEDDNFVITSADGNPVTLKNELLNIAGSYGQIDGDHHKMWVIDQMVRTILDYDYVAFVEWYERDGNYEWDTGIAP